MPNLFSRFAMNRTTRLLSGASTTRAQKRNLYTAIARVRTGSKSLRETKSSSGRWTSLRRASTETGEDETGHIKANLSEGILFFDNLIPLRLNWLTLIPWRSDGSLSEILWKYNNSRLSVYDPLTLIKRAIPSSIPIKVTEILPRVKDGGAFVKFSHPDGVTAKEVEGLVSEYLKENPIKPWFSPFRSIQAKLVQGKPWLEDLYRFPCYRLKVEFVPPEPGAEAAELSQETLYSLFRRYGKLAEISSQPSDSKVLPKYAYLDYARMRHGIMARNCLHGYKVGEEAGGGKLGTVLRLSYERKTKTHWIRDWIVNHPRVVIPILAALLGTLAVAVFDPIRTFFIKAHIDQAFNLQNNRFVKWLTLKGKDFLHFRAHRSEAVSLSAIWDDRKAVIDQLNTWLMETSGSFIIVQGPRGTGKKELILDQALKNRPNTLLIDCKPIQEARGDAATIQAAAAAVGYRPVFSWMNSVSSLMDLAIQGTTGVKTGFSETLDNQLAKIWQQTTTALTQIALKNRKKGDNDEHLSDDDWLETHPECRPVIVLDNFLHKSNEESNLMYDRISEWAANITTSNVAHVIFLTNDVSYSKSLSKALPDRVFRNISLGDITSAVARKFVINHLDSDNEAPGSVDEPKMTPSQRRDDLDDLDESIEVLGGRLTDLEFFARRLKTGQTPGKAVSEIIDQSASEILKMYLLTAKSDLKWSTEQVWVLIKALASDEELRYNELLLSSTFSSSLTPSATKGESALEALAQAELIAIEDYKGRPQTIKAGKPVYLSAFKLLVEDRVLKSKLDLAVLAELTKIETKSIDKYETELNMLANLPKQPREVGPRVQYLLSKLEASQTRVEAWEKEMGGLKRVLKSDL